MEDATYNLIICGNDETICDGYCDTDKDIAREFVNAAANVISDARINGADVDHAVDSNFANWHGGKHTKFQFGKERWGYTAGLVVCHERNCPQWVADLCDAAEEAGSVARAAAVAVDEAEQAAFEAEEQA